MNTPIYDVDYFIRKFSVIPESLWDVSTAAYYGLNNGRKCAMGFCKESHHADMDSMYNDIGGEGYCLVELFKTLGEIEVYRDVRSNVWRVNDGSFRKYPQPHPKQRILAALHDIKKLQTPKVKEVIRYVSVSESLKKQTKELIEN